MYEGEVAQLDMVPELVGRFRGAIDGLRSLVDVARGTVGGVTGNVFEEVEERFAHPFVFVHHERDEFLVHLLDLPSKCQKSPLTEWQNRQNTKVPQKLTKTGII